MSRVPPLGRHETGQNFLIDRSVLADFTAAVSSTRGPIFEIGAGDGALTRAVATLGRPVTALELDASRARKLAARAPASVQVVCGDVLHVSFPEPPHVVVGNLPFHLTTAILRRLFKQPAWTDAVLLVQWEVARRRAGIGGATMLTAQEWPWFEFRLLRRVPAQAFRPSPSVDGGLLHVIRRRAPLVQDADRRAYQRFVGDVFTGPGRGLPAILRRAARGVPLGGWVHANRVTSATLPRHLGAEQWAELWACVRQQQPRTAVPRRTRR